MIHVETTPAIETSDKTLKGWHVLLIMLGFFGIMFAVNGVFLYHAITSFPGEHVKKSYVQGLNYNDTLAARAAQAELGWQVEAGLQDEALIVRLHDADDQPLSNLSVIGELRRSATTAADQAIVFQLSDTGEYRADPPALEPGQWELHINVYDADLETLQFTAGKTLIIQ